MSFSAGYIFFIRLFLLSIFTTSKIGYSYNILLPALIYFFKKNQNASRPSEHPPVMKKKMSKRLGGIKGSKYKTSSWHLNRFPDSDKTGSTV